MPPIIPQTCSSTRPQKWENGFHTHKHVHPHGHKTSSSMAATLSLVAAASPKPHSINPTSSNRFNDRLDGAKKGSTGTRSWRWASGLAEWISESHVTQSAAASALHVTDAEACFLCFALCFNFLSFDFFGAN